MSTLQTLLVPCEKACQLLGGEKYSTVSAVLPLIALLRKEMKVSEDDSDYSRKFKEGMFTDLITRLDKIQ